MDVAQTENLGGGGGGQKMNSNHTPKCKVLLYFELNIIYVWRYVKKICFGFQEPIYIIHSLPALLSW